MKQLAKSQPRIEKHKYQEKTKTKNESLIQTTLTQYVRPLKNLKKTINGYITRATEKKLQSIYKSGYDSKC